MDNFLDRYQVPKFNQDQINDLNSLTSPKEIEAAINSRPTKNAQECWGQPVVLMSGFQPGRHLGAEREEGI